jgi:hypothetical protein
LAMSILPISIIASKARLASAPPAAIASVRVRGVICQPRLFYLKLASRHESSRVFSMPTLTKTKKAVVKKAAVAKRPADARMFPGLVRDPLTGLLVNPLKPGQKLVSRAVLQKALADAL